MIAKEQEKCVPAKKYPAPAGYTVALTSFGKYYEIYRYKIGNNSGKGLIYYFRNCLLQNSRWTPQYR